MSSQPSGPPRKGQRNEMRMISRAAEVLRALAEEPAGLSLGQLAKATGLARSTVQRLVGALEAEGFAVTRPGQPGVKLGAELVRLGSAVHANLRSLFRPFLQELNHQTKDTVDLTLLMNGLPVVIDQITSTASLRVVSFVGRPLPLHCTASGKAHVSAMTDDEAKALLTPPLKGYTARGWREPRMRANFISIRRSSTKASAPLRCRSTPQAQTITPLRCQCPRPGSRAACRNCARRSKLASVKWRRRRGRCKAYSVGSAGRGRPASSFASTSPMPVMQSNRTTASSSKQVSSSPCVTAKLTPMIA
jgi:IclR family acetate operon transcriptional repressor